MSDQVFDRWFWITILSVVLIIVMPLIIVWGIIQLPPEIAILATVCLVIIWGVVSGYKDWVVSGRAKAEDESKQV